MNVVLIVVIVDIQLLVNAAVIDAPMWIKTSCIYHLCHIEKNICQDPCLSLFTQEVFLFSELFVEPNQPIKFRSALKNDI